MIVMVEFGVPLPVFFDFSRDSPLSLFSLNPFFSSGWAAKWGTPPPRGYLGRKILVFNGLQRDGVCKIFKTNWLRAKYLLSMN
jgi:hypothetical protein